MIASRRRMWENKKHELPNTKCTYILKSFDKRFTAEEHNTYFKNRSALKRKLSVKAIAKGKNKTFLNQEISNIKDKYIFFQKLVKN